jgi:hypothetical protein
MSQSTFSGPVKAGTVREGATPNLGYMVMMQSGTISQASTAVVSSTVYIPANSRILEFFVDSSVAWDSGTSATLSIGTAAGGTQYVASVDAKATAGRLTISHTTTQLTAMSNVGATQTVTATVTPSGTTTAGALKWAVVYAQQ